MKIRDVVNRHIGQVVAECGGNLTQASRVLGIDRRTLYRKVTEDPGLRRALDGARLASFESRMGWQTQTEST